jgi:hypothetical protein
MRGIRHAINAEFDLLTPHFSRLRPSGLDNLRNREDGSEQVGCGCEGDDARLRSDEGEEIFDVMCDGVRILRVGRLCVPVFDRGADAFGEFLPGPSVGYSDAMRPINVRSQEKGHISVHLRALQ